jgi:uncharacterized protein with HEPN domain
LRHIIEFAERVESFVSGRKREDLERKPLLAFAHVRAIELTGEAAAQTSDATKQASPDVPWRRIVAMRHRLIHAYAEIDRDIVRKTATEEVPALRHEIEKVLEEHER